MKTPILLAAALVGIALTAAACGTTSSANGYGSSPTSSPTSSPVSASPSPVPVAPGTAIVDVGQTSLGSVLVDKAGRTLYLFLADKGTSSACYGQCATYWPPLTTTDKPQVGMGADAALVGTSARTDGTTMVTYNGHPLYYFIGDKKAGDVSGQRVNGFGAFWYVVSPSGTQIG